MKHRIGFFEYYLNFILIFDIVSLIGHIET